MPLITWSKEYDVRVEEMNDQHKALIRLMNELHQLSREGAAKTQILGQMNGFYNFARSHFAAEEKYMATIQYDGLRNHALIHGALLTTLSDLIAEYKASYESVPEKFFMFLNKWLASHIKGMDRKYGDYAHEFARAANA